MNPSPELTREQRESNLLDIVRMALAELRGESFSVRRRGLLYVVTLLGHRMTDAQLRDQPWGTVGQCENCGQIAKVARSGDSIEGRATFTVCPAGRKP
jgi:hypothetical protein